MDYILANIPTEDLSSWIYKILIPYKHIIDNMDRTSLDNLSNYINKCIYKPYTRIGTIYAQELLHEITQSSLSGKVLGITKYLPIVDIINLKRSNSKCYINEDREVIYSSISCVTFLDIISYVTINGDDWIIHLNKEIMSLYNISKQDITPHLTKKQSYTHNADPCIILYSKRDSNESISQLHDEISCLESMCIKGVNGVRVKVDPLGNYYCNSQFYKELKDRGYNVFCNDIVTSYEVDGIESCRSLVYDSLISNKGISTGCAMMISIYMTMLGEPIAFNKKLTYDKLGPMFDMYFDRPIKTLIKWLDNKTVDRSNNPYTCIMLGNPIQ